MSECKLFAFIDSVINIASETREGMILAVDIHYRHTLAIAGGIVFADWTAQQEDAVYRSELRIDQDYIPGEFYRRELPCILCLIEEHKLVPDTVVVDGYVYLDGFCLPGLGKHLFDALAGRASIIGVAKRRLIHTPDETTLYRGQSRRPLYITSVGISLDMAKSLISSMHGPFRIPYLLKRVDQISKMT